MIQYTFGTDTIGFEDIASISYFIYLNGEKTIWDLVVDNPNYTFMLWKAKEGPYLIEWKEENTITEEFALQIYEIIISN
jgi:hypothetical protein